MNFIRLLGNSGEEVVELPKEIWEFKQTRMDARIVGAHPRNNELQYVYFLHYFRASGASKSAVRCMAFPTCESSS